MVIKELRCRMLLLGAHHKVMGLANLWRVPGNDTVLTIRYATHNSNEITYILCGTSGKHPKYKDTIQEGYDEFVGQLSE